MRTDTLSSDVSAPDRYSPPGSGGSYLLVLVLLVVVVLAGAVLLGGADAPHDQLGGTGTGPEPSTSLSPAG